MQYLTQNFAQVYGGCNYGSSGYEQGSCQAQAAGGAQGASGGGILTNTGFDILLVVTLACAIAFLAVVVRFWHRPAKR